jgi:phosphoglycolate phosphatase
MMIILFDLDGTLIDSTEAILESFRVSYESFGEIVPENEKIKKLIGLPLDIMFSKLGVEDDKVWDYVNRYKKHYRTISRQKTTLLPFAKESIIKASEIAILGIVTTKTARYSQELMEHFGVMNYFKVLIGREDVENPKPHPEPILKALQQLNHKDEKVYMIGDTCLDIISAKEAGVTPIAVYSGYASKEKLHNCSEIVVKDALKAVEMIFSTSF